MQLELVIGPIILFADQPLKLYFLVAFSNGDFSSVTQILVRLRWSPLFNYNKSS